MRKRTRLVTRTKFGLPATKSTANRKSSDVAGAKSRTLQSSGNGIRDTQGERSSPVDFPASTKVIPDKLCKSLVGFIGARHLTIEYLFTTEEMIEQNPDVVRKVVAALRDGIQDTVDNPAAAIKHTLSYNSELVEAEQLRRLEATIPLMNVPNRQLGGMDPEVWQYSHDFLLERGILSEPVNLDEVYTLEFLTEEVAEAK